MARTKKAKRRQSYTTKRRATILATVKEVGVVEAARKHGVPQTTISNWLNRDAAKVANETASPSASTSKRVVAKSYTPSARAEVLEHAAAHGATAASEKFGVSRFSIYAWKHKVAKAAKGEGPSPTSGPGAVEIEEKRDREIVEEYKAHPGLGPSQVRNQLRRRGVKVSVMTTRRVMEDAGYRPPKVERKKHDRRYNAVRPNAL